MISETGPPALDGERRDRVVALLADLSRADAARTIAAGAVTLDDSTASSGKVRLSEGQTVQIDPAGYPVTEPPGPDDDVMFEVLHVDDAVIVIDKPPGLVVHPGAGNATGTLVTGLLARFPEIVEVGDDPVRPGIVHRLDAGSSGLMVVARTNEAAQRLIAQFADHSAHRVYEAMVWGIPDAPHGIIDAPIGRSRSDPLRMAVVEGGRAARTDYQVLGSYRSPAELTRLHCRLETGRTHQIRVHLLARGHPILGDPAYARRRNVRVPVPRLMLHALRLSFPHPVTAETVEVEAPLPADFQGVLDALRG